MHDFLITSSVTESPVDIPHASECGVGTFFISLNLWFSFSEWNEISVFINMTVLSTYEKPSSTTLAALPPNSPVCSQDQRADYHIASLLMSHNSLQYQATPCSVPWKPSSSPCSAHPSRAHDWWLHSWKPPAPFGWQKMSASLWEMFKRCWGMEFLSLLPLGNMEPSKRSRSKLQICLLTFLFSVHAWEHEHSSADVTHHPVVGSV